MNANTEQLHMFLYSFVYSNGSFFSLKWKSFRGSIEHVIVFLIEPKAKFAENYTKNLGISSICLFFIWHIFFDFRSKFSPQTLLSQNVIISTPLQSLQCDMLQRASLAFA